MDEPLDELYLKWLYSQVGDPRIKNPRRTYWTVLRQLFQKEFVWLIPNDDNRAADGKELRYEFVNDNNIQDVDLAWVHQGVSMLELLVGLSRRLAFAAEGEPRDWFWELMGNLGFRHFNDADKDVFSPEEIDEKLDRVIYRTYSPSGQGGLFPLWKTDKDQRCVELWYQLSEYVLERVSSKVF